MVSEALFAVVLLSWWGYFVEFHTTKNGLENAVQTVQWQS